MSLLKQGSAGRAVKDLQEKLKALGFDPKGIDGHFGPGTLAAVTAFQKSKKLRADGLVGLKTLAAIRAAVKSAGSGATSGPGKSKTGVGDKSGTGTGEALSIDVPSVAKMFPGVPSKNIEENLPFVLRALKDAGLDDLDMILMALATIRAETGNFTPLSEFQSRFNTPPSGPPFSLYDHRKDLGNQGPPDGANFRGRGYIQLTGRDNYRTHGQAIGLDDQLITNPKLANDPQIAGKLLASFLQSQEKAIRQALASGNLKKARKLVNGGSHGLAEFTAAFNIGKRVLV
ncbi:MAG: peptidoglycan-binding protein [Pyrinomonadaceae bacterium]